MESVRVEAKPRQPSELAFRVTRTILDRIAKGTLPLPSMPIAALKCLNLVRQVDFSMRDSARVIEEDPVLAARVLSVCNSSAFCGAQKARNVMQAVARIGVDNLRIVLFEAAASQIFKSSDRRIREACAALWQHSRAVAGCARAITLLADAGDPNEAYLGGLLHDIGKPIIALLLVQSENRLSGKQTEIWLDPDTWLDIVQQGHREVGIALTSKWVLPDIVVSAVANCSTYDASNVSSIANCVRLANALTKEAGIYVGHFDEAEIQSVVLTGQSLLGLSDADIGTLRSDLHTSFWSDGAVKE